MSPKKRKKNKKRATCKKCPTSPTKTDSTSDTTVESINDPIQCSKLSTASALSVEASTTSKKTIATDPLLCSKSPAVNISSAEPSTTSDKTPTSNQYQQPMQPVPSTNDPALGSTLPKEKISPTKAITSSDSSMYVKDTTLCSNLPLENISFDVSSLDTTVKNIDDTAACSKFATENIAYTETSTSPTGKKVDDTDLFSKSLTESTLSADISTCSDTTVKNVDDSAICSKLSTANITSIDVSTPSGTIVKNVVDPVIYSKFVSVKSKVPDIFLHQPANLAQHIQELSSMGINFKQPYTSIYYTKIKCPTYDDKKAITQYFEKKKLPYHTFCDPFKRKIKVVIRGFPKDIDIYKIKSELESVNIPIIRVHKMKLKKRETENNNTSLILAVVPCSDEGIKLLRVEKILGHHIKLETPKPKTKQCHRCQLWGHTQRYCHGQVKCVKCAGDHLSKKCIRDASKEPPKCANCGGKHTANYRQCPCCPDSSSHQQSQKIKHNRMQVLYRRKDYDTSENYDNL